MVRSTESASARVRARLNHPVIDADGHLLEVSPVLLDYVKQIGGTDMAEKYENSAPIQRFHRQQVVNTPLDQRRHHWATLTTWWMFPTKNGLDRATAQYPKLLNERLDDLGIDFAILYPTEGLILPVIQDQELRRVACRAVNTYMAETFGGYSERMTPVAQIPTHTPQEAIEDLDFAVSTLGLKTAVFSGYVVRPVPRVAEDFPRAAGYAPRLDLLALDSDYDYDPLWEKCRELKVAPTFHNTSMGIGTHRSISNFVFNHLGGAADGLNPVARALVLGGVTNRFPDLNFAFLEGGVAWGVALYSSLIDHFEKRNIEALDWVDPRKLDPVRQGRLLEEYGEGRVLDLSKEVQDSFYHGPPVPSPDQIDEFAACGAKHPEDFQRLFAKPFYFGCEADDKLSSLAFNARLNPFGDRLNAILGSDIGHWDVQQMDRVIAEAYELVEDELLSPDDFRAFTFENAVRLHATVNPGFFRGTSVAAAAEGTMGGAPAGRS